MNVIEYKIDKINTDKLDDLLSRGYIKKLKDICFYMSEDTLNCMNSLLKTTPKIQYVKNKNSSCLPYYRGVLIATTDRLKFGEVELLGFEEKQCTRLTMYTDGTQKIETNVTDKVLIVLA